ncbi:MAG TPA: hypothetical protein VK934_07230 [Fimbriimonas sp.]|nr:hypothetical protein [Fimbriimonas sp.]
MRIWIACALGLTSTIASADRLIYIPTARKIPYRTFKYELRAEPRVQGEMEHYLGIGLTPFWEVEVRSQNLQLDRPQGTFDLAYNYLSPFTNLTPGISIGVQDVLNKTAEGQRPFLAVTFRQGFFTIGGEVPADLTLGLSVVKSRLYPFLGASIPFSQEVRLLAEHDGFRISVAAEVKPIRMLALRFIVREKSSLLGFVIQHRF